jgi:uncharacterized protein (DUF1697 family)
VPTRYVAFLRGLNVGGHRVGNDVLAEAVGSVGLAEVSTFLASGNVVFEDADDVAADDLEALIAAALEERLGYAVPTFVRTLADLVAIATEDPFAGVGPAGGTRQVGFLRHPLDVAARERLAGLNSETDLLVPTGREVHWFTTAGVSDSPLFRGSLLERVIGDDVTFRNVTTLRRLTAKYPPRAV